MLIAIAVSALMCAGGMGYVLKKYQVSMGIISIGVDYFQVLAGGVLG